MRHLNAPFSQQVDCASDNIDRMIEEQAAVSREGPSLYIAHAVGGDGDGVVGGGDGDVEHPCVYYGLRCLTSS